MATAVALLQAGLCALAIVGDELGSIGVEWLGVTAFTAGVAAILALDSPNWRPAEIAVGKSEGVSAGAAPVDEA